MPGAPLELRGRLRTRFDDVIRVLLPASYAVYVFAGRPAGVALGIAMIALLAVQSLSQRFGRVRVGRDGLSVDASLFGREATFLPWHRVEAVTASGKTDVRLTLAGKARVVATAGKEDAAQLLEAVRARIEQVTADRRELSATLDALSGSPARWAARLRGAGDAYREGGASEDTLRRALESPSTSGLARVGAAVMLRAAGTDLDAIRAAGADCEDPKTRAALEALADDDGERAARVLDAWEDEEEALRVARVATEGPADEATVLEPSGLLQGLAWSLRAWPLVLAIGALANLAPVMIAGAAMASFTGLARAWLNDRNPGAKARRAKVRVAQGKLEVEGRAPIDPKEHRVFLRFEEGKEPVLHVETPGGWHVVEARGQTEEVTRAWLAALGSDAGTRAVSFPTLIPSKVWQAGAQAAGFGVIGAFALAAQHWHFSLLGAFAAGFAVMFQLVSLRRTIDVRPDGVEIRVLWRRRFVAWSEVAEVWRGRKGGALVLSDGERVPLRAVPNDEHAGPDQRNDFLVERAHDAFVAWRARRDVEAESREQAALEAELARPRVAAGVGAEREVEAQDAETQQAEAQEAEAQEAEAQEEAETQKIGARNKRV